MSVTLDRPYCTLEEVQKECRNKDSVQNDWFSTCINNASRAVDDFLRRDYLLHDHRSTPLKVKRDWLAEPNRLVLPWPILTLTAITQSGAGLSAADYDFTAGENSITYIKQWPEFLFPSPALYLTGTFGYAQEATDGATKPPVGIPAPVRHATVLIASAWSVQNRTEKLSLEGQTQSLLDTKIPDEARKLLEPKIYRFL
jgi:hypothetical protein